MGCKFNPCCIPLQNGVLTISIFRMIISAACAIFGILVLVFGTDMLKHVQLDLQVLKELEANGEFEEEQLNPTTVKNVFGIVFIIVGIITFIFDFVLYKGAKQGNGCKCGVWIIFAAITLILTLIQVIGGGVYVDQKFAEIVGVIMQIYFIIVVWAYRKEIQQEKYAQRQIKQDGVDETSA